MNSAGSKILIYSHDTFGLGHLRRCRAIAHALVGEFDKLSALILSGSPIVGTFDYRARVDFVRIPGVIKLRGGEYEPLSLHIDIEDTLRLRASIIRHTAEAFEPDILIVDKEPLGLRGEVEETLEALKARGTRLILGLRDVLDAPGALVEEWRRKGVYGALQDLYDEIWVYGLREIYDPLVGLELGPGIRAKTVFTGYLQRAVPTVPPSAPVPRIAEGQFVLVTTGGGGDGGGLVDWVLAAHEANSGALPPTLIVLGPFMAAEAQAGFRARAERLANVEIVTFDSRIERLESRAAGIVCMGGYNTFCEILSLDKPSLLVPRARPRAEQLIRARQAAAHGLVRMIEDPAEEGLARDPQVMAEAIATLVDAQAPPVRSMPGLLNGFDVIAERVAPYLRPESVRVAAEPGPSRRIAAARSAD